MDVSRRFLDSRFLFLLSVLLSFLAHCDVSYAVTSKLTKRQSDGIVRCLKASNPLGCGSFECLERNSRCNLGGLALLCRKFQRKAASFNQLDIGGKIREANNGGGATRSIIAFNFPEMITKFCKGRAEINGGKTFTKQSLRCVSGQIKADFQRAGRQCSQIETFISRVQIDCYRSSNICRAALTNNKHFKQILPPKDILTVRPSLQMFQSILSCGEAVTVKFRDTVTSALGQSFLSMLNYLQKGATSPLIEILGQNWIGSTQFQALENEVPGSTPR